MGESIDTKGTGELLKKSISDAGYQVADIQKYLGLSCPQPVYRWYNGKALPTVDHLRALSILLGKHMEDLIVTSGKDEKITAPKLTAEGGENKLYKRLMLYFYKICITGKSGGDYRSFIESNDRLIIE